MKGCRRPHLDRQLSDTYPISGSVTASTMIAMLKARLVSTGDRPSTCE